MGKFEFYQDCKVTSWERDYFTVEANSYEEAEAIVRSWRCKDVSNIIDSRLSCHELLLLVSRTLFPDPDAFLHIAYSRPYRKVLFHS